MTSPIETALFAMLAPLAPGKSVGPEEVARAVDPEGWRRMLPRVRAVAVGLARQGQLAITRHGKPVDPGKFKGVYRLRLPMEGDAVFVAEPVEPKAPEVDDAPEDASAL